MPARGIENIDQLKTLIGQELGSSDWITVDQSMIDAFARVTGDDQWIHVDPERAKNESNLRPYHCSRFSDIFAAEPLQPRALRIGGDFRMRINYGLNRVRFTAPVPEGFAHSRKIHAPAVEDIARGTRLSGWPRWRWRARQNRR